MFNPLFKKGDFVFYLANKMKFKVIALETQSPPFVYYILPVMDPPWQGEGIETVESSLTPFVEPTPEPIPTPVPTPEPTPEPTPIPVPSDTFDAAEYTKYVAIYHGLENMRLQAEQEHWQQGSYDQDVYAGWYQGLTGRIRGIAQKMHELALNDPMQAKASVIFQNTPAGDPGYPVWTNKP